VIPHAPRGTIRLGPFDPHGRPSLRGPVASGHPAVLLVRELIPEWVDTTVVCPHCPLGGDVVTVLDHLFAEHGSGLRPAAEWLETVDCDLFSLAVHQLIGDARTAETPISGS
jgi:hypothetical protein